MNRPTLKAQKRKILGKTKKLAHDGIIPGVAYDQKTASHPIKLLHGDVEKMLSEASLSTIIQLEIEDQKPSLALVKEVQRDPRSHTIQHISFMMLDPKVEVTIPVGISSTGESPAVKNNLGVLIYVTETINLTGLPEAFPEYLEIDISNLGEIGDRISVKEVDIPSELRLIHESDKDLTIATILPFQKAEEVVEEKSEETEEGEEGEEVEETEGETPEEGEQPEVKEEEGKSEGKKE
ncbi:50S ribosomal protein L25 [Candidatus Dojkabacteria bacterium]|nr:50S ribosomal protein L25 [Candidatus Dojkabacteria bacterium]